MYSSKLNKNKYNKIINKFFNQSELCLRELCFLSKLR